MKMLLALSIAAAALAQPAIKSVPPAGIEISASDRAELQASLDHLRAATTKLHGNALLPDVLIYQEAVRYALANGVIAPGYRNCSPRIAARQASTRSRSATVLST